MKKCLFLTVLFAFFSSAHADLKGVYAENAFSLYGKFDGENPGRNVCYSPYSFQRVLEALYCISGEETQKKIESVLKVPEGEFFKYSKIFGNSCEGKSFLSKTSFWSDEQFSALISPFTDSLKKNTDVQFFRKNFSNKESVLNEINLWVKENSGGILDDSGVRGIKKDTVVIVNVSRFEQNWKVPFELLADGIDFFNHDGKMVNVPAMTAKNAVCVKIHGFSILQIFYEDSRHSMIIVADGKPGGAPLSQGEYQAILKTLRQNRDREYITLVMPKFRVDSDLDYIKPMRQMGLGFLFSPGSEFYNNGRVIEFVSRSVFDVNEKSTKVASSSALTFSWSTGGDLPEIFILNRPFEFFIMDDIDDCLLFMGKINKL